MLHDVTKLWNGEVLQTIKINKTLREKCPYSELFRIRSYSGRNAGNYGPE